MRHDVEMHHRRRRGRLLALSEGGGAWLSTRAALRTFLAANDGADNPHSLSAMASPPTITTSTSDLSATYPNMVVMATQANVDTYALIENGRQALAASVFEQPYAATQSSGTLVKVASRISVTANADVVAFYVIGTTLAYRFLVNDQYIDFTGTVPAATSGTGSNYIVLTFASKASRKITIELQQSCAVRRIQIKSGDSYGTKPTAKGRRGLVLGDSVTAATGATAFGDGYVHVAGDYLGMELWPSGVGSTGYVNTSSGTRYKLSERIATDLDSALLYGSLDIVAVAMGLNDLGLAGIQAEAETCFSIIRGRCPAALVFVVNTWDAGAPAAPSSNYNTAKAAIQAAVGSRGGFWFINPEGTSYTKADATHPDTAGHTTLGLWLEDQIRTAIAA